jgi:Pre-mRNA 3'-end-processing endonuclease polyadenylation factor C-term
LLLLESQFASVTPLPNPEAGPMLEIAVPPHVARVHLRDLRVESSNNALRTRVAAVIEKACEAVVGMAG